jgi:DNA-binding transcriptional ArsR family regulator
MQRRRKPSDKTRSDNLSRRIGASDIFSAVFSQKPVVCQNRLAILKSLNKSSAGETRFAELLRDVQSSRRLMDYSSQRLTYDLQVLKDNALIDQTVEGNYTITKYGSYVLDVYSRIEKELSENKIREKPGFVGGVTGIISAEGFDHELLANELCRLPFFKKTPSVEENKIGLEFRDDDENFESDIEISKEGDFAVQVTIYESILNIENSFMEDLMKTTKWHKIAQGFAYIILYYIERVSKKLWKNAEVKVLLGPDSYPLNIYMEHSET